MKLETLHHPKLTLLARRLNLPVPFAAGILECLWCFAAQHTPDGRIGRYPAEVITALIGHTGDPAELFNALVECRWLDADPGGWLLHDWREHCGNGVHQRLARAGQAFADGSLPDPARLTPKDRKRLTLQVPATTSPLPAPTPTTSPLASPPLKGDLVGCSSPSNPPKNTQKKGMTVSEFMESSLNAARNAEHDPDWVRHDFERLDAAGGLRLSGGTQTHGKRSRALEGC